MDHYSVTRTGDTITVAPLGDIDLASTAELRHILQNAVNDASNKHVIIDLDGVTFIDSTAIGVLVASRTAAIRRGATLAVTNPRPMVTMVLTVTGLFDLLVGPSGPPASAESGPTAEKGSDSETALASAAD